MAGGRMELEMQSIKTCIFVVLATVAGTALPAPASSTPGPSPTPSVTPGPPAYDVEVFGARIKAKVGQVVEVQVRAHNRGPGPAIGSGGVMGPKHYVNVS